MIKILAQAMSLLFGKPKPEDPMLKELFEYRAKRDSRPPNDKLPTYLGQHCYSGRGPISAARYWGEIAKYEHATFKGKRMWKVITKEGRVCHFPASMRFNVHDIILVPIEGKKQFIVTLNDFAAHWRAV